MKKFSISKYLFYKFFSDLNEPFLVEENKSTDGSFKYVPYKYIGINQQEMYKHNFGKEIETKTVEYCGKDIYYVTFHFHTLNLKHFKKLTKKSKILAKKFKIKNDDMKIVGSYNNPGNVILRIIIRGKNVKKLFGK